MLSVSNIIYIFAIEQLLDDSRRKSSWNPERKSSVFTFSFCLSLCKCVCGLKVTFWSCSKLPLWRKGSKWGIKKDIQSISRGLWKETGYWYNHGVWCIILVWFFLPKTMEIIIFNLKKKNICRILRCSDANNWNKQTNKQIDKIR